MNEQSTILKAFQQISASAGNICWFNPSILHLKSPAASQQPVPEFCFLGLSLSYNRYKLWPPATKNEHWNLNLLSALRWYPPTSPSSSALSIRARGCWDSVNILRVERCFHCWLIAVWSQPLLLPANFSLPGFSQSAAAWLWGLLPVIVQYLLLIG